MADLQIGAFDFASLVTPALAALFHAGYNRSVPSISQTVRIKVLFFGRLKEIVGHVENSVELPEGSSIESLFAAYTANHSELANYRSSLVASQNQEFAPWNSTLHSGDEIAFLPPVSGG